MITTYKHLSISGYTADLNHSTGDIIFYKTTPKTGRRLFSLRARSWPDLERQTRTQAQDWVIDSQSPKETQVQLILGENEIKEALASYLSSLGYELKPEDVEKIVLRRKSSKNEDVGRVVLTLKDRA